MRYKWGMATPSMHLTPRLDYHQHGSGAYQGGARALDISGELRGDLLAQGRELAWLFTADNKGNLPRATFSWGAVVHKGIVYVPDINTGLWIMKMEPKQMGKVVP